MIIIRACNSSIILLALTGTIVAFQQHARHHNRRFLRKLYHKYYDCLQLSSARFLSPLPSSSALSSSSQQQKQQHDTDDDNFYCVFNIPNLNSISNHKLRFRREQAQQLLDETNNNLFPSTTYRDRIGFGRVAVEEDYNNNEKKKKNKNRDGSQSSSTSSSSSPTRSTQILKADDPRLKMTYAEFPLSSYDALLDVALQYLNYSSTTKTNANDNPTKSKTASSSSSSSLSPNSPVNFVDIGSGLGVYSAVFALFCFLRVVCLFVVVVVVAVAVIVIVIVIVVVVVVVVAAVIVSDLKSELSRPLSVSSVHLLKVDTVV